MSTLTGTRPMFGLTVRRERLHGTAWYLLSAVLLVGIAAGIAASYPSAADRDALARSVNTSAGELFLIGPVASSSVGGVGLWRMLGIAAIFISLASIFTMVRNTRAVEESGIGEMLGSAAIGRTAPLASTLIVTTIGSLVSGLVVCAGLLALGTGGVGAALAGAQIALFGFLAAGIAAFASQIVQTSRGATSIAVTVVAAFYVLRGAGDVVGGDAYWISPFGWITAVRPFADNNAWMLLPALALTAVLTGVAIRIASRRDLGAGLFPERIGRSTASPALRGPFSLALRISRGTIIGWVMGAAIIGLMIGGVAATVDGQIDLALGGNAGTGSGLVQVALYLSPLFAAILGILTTTRIRGEVTSGRAEAVLSRPVARPNWLLAYALTGAFAAFAMLLAFGLAVAVAGLGTHPGSFGVLAIAAALRAPAAWVFIGLAALLLGVIPRAASTIAFVIVGLFQALEFGIEFRLVPSEALTVSPFALVPQLPGGPGHPLQTLLLIVIAAGLMLMATRAIRHQDIK